MIIIILTKMNNKTYYYKTDKYKYNDVEACRVINDC